MAITQANRPMEVKTPLGTDKLIITGFNAHEAISQLFSLQVDVVAAITTDVAFDQLLGQSVTVRLDAPEGKKRFFNGICSRVSEGKRDNDFTSYRLEVVPKLWLLTKKAQSRIFQQKNVPDILRDVLGEYGLDPQVDIQGTFEPRDYVVQYRETDFNFVSRLMEEEGIYYFFKHEDGSHKLVLANTPGSHPDVPLNASIIFEQVVGGFRNEDRIYDWSKVQELRSGKYLLWDHCFELPHKHLQADKGILGDVQVGTVSHKQKMGVNENLEVYDYPGEYAQRFDGVTPGGGDRAADLQKIFTDNKRTVGIRMQQEAVGGLVLQGSSTCRQLVSGHKFTLTRHFNANGGYVLTSVHHNANVSIDFQSGQSGQYLYSNGFTAIPIAQPFRPIRETPKPFVQGTQTALVVGPKSEEIFTDKYGRVKVQFHWDRKGDHNEKSSCWVRVTQPWAGKRWGASFWPRVGQEVIVDFLEGDPDRPICVGTVYNADQMPPYLGEGFDDKHKNDNKISGIKSSSTPGGEGFNEWRFDDNKGKEQIFIHAQKDMDERVLNDTRELVLNNRHLIVGQEKDGSKVGDQREMIYRDKHLQVHRDQIEQIGRNMQLHIGGIDGGDGNQDVLIDGTRTVTTGKNDQLHVQGDRKQAIDGDTSLAVGGDQQEKIGNNHILEAGQEIHIKAGMKVIIEAGAQLSLVGPGGFIDIGPSGVTIQGTMVLINSGGAAGSGTPANLAYPDEPKEAQPTKPDLADDSKSGKKSMPDDWASLT
jgi:type VI secretion system secreted protein VgrG